MIRFRYASMSEARSLSSAATPGAVRTRNRSVAIACATSSPTISGSAIGNAGARGGTGLPYKQNHQGAACDAQEVDVHDALPGLQRDVLHGADGEDAHVVHDHVNAPEALASESPGGFQIGHAGDIATRGDGLRADLRGDGVGPAD